MRFPLAALLFLATLGTCRGEVPKLFCQRDFSTVDLAEAVNHYVALGETEAVRRLNDLHTEGELPQSMADFLPGDLTMRVCWVCRILFVSKDGKPLRSTEWGGGDFPINPSALDLWPLFPVTASGKSYFVLSRGSPVAGLREPREAYIDYCRAEGAFRVKPVPVPSRAEAQRDAARLRRSAAWKASLRVGKGSDSKVDDEGEWRFIRGQVDSIR